ncbi:heparan sulfate 2-O-sulfotransferase pipe-like [Pollicipes pollicipes]|uniref:heparan sulfate 2-O-sulfotransferase pipe-like n=1 Tax=Pollicipes pollicipes TaxID=41117 RepID=UPI0018853F71|nr:heparan sulfate 2-O-sulfotransferase pipe-like [Pollicipes pollicipes]
MVKEVMHVWRRWRQRVPWRLSELLALMLLTATVFLFLHTNDLSAQLASAKRRQQAQTAALAAGPSRENRSPLAVHGHTGSGDGRRRPAHPPPTSQYKFGELNVTKYAVKETLFFNRVPKVGSQSTMQLMKRLSYRNKFNFHKDHPQKVELINLKPPQEKRLCSLINIFRPPAVYVKHVCFLNFPRYNFSPPIYFNMVRDPVERIISWYYYVRAPWYFVERKRAFPELELPDPAWLKKDYEECVLSNDWECQYITGDKKDRVGDHRRMTGFFCGMDEDCSAFNSEVAMQKAKRNVEKYYAVVGVLEEMNKTLAVLEHYIPRFFAGAAEIYHEEKKLSKVNKNGYKPPVSEYVKDIVRKNFTHEIEFYEFCRQRLHQQYLALGLQEDL